MTRKLTILIVLLLTGGLLWMAGDFLVSDSVIIDGIKVEHTLYENLSPSRRLALRWDIKKTLSGDESSLRNLVLFDCGGAAGCYDLGFVLTQLIYRLGEKHFAEMAKSLTKDELATLESLIIVGLGYGDNDNDGKADDRKIDKEFLVLYKFFLDKRNADIPK
jgi:hypothetical protein